MNNSTLFWLIIFAISATCFFVIAAIVAYRGFGDLRVLLQHTRRRSRRSPEL